MLPEHVDLLSRAAAIIAIVAAVIQAVAAVVIARLTGKLERVTERYANSTDAAVRASQEHFEREWRPDLRIADVQVVGVGQVFLRIANLAKPPALIKQLKIGTGGRSEQGVAPQDIEIFPFVLLVTGGQVQDQSKIERELGIYRQKHNPPPIPLRRSPWEANLNVALVYDSAGIETQTEWLDFNAEFMDNIVTSLNRIDYPKQ